MCNIKRKTRRKTVTVYKTVTKIGENYYSPFAGTKIAIGKVIPQTKRDFKRMDKRSFRATFFNPDKMHYNPHMVGKMSGFADIKHAKKLYDSYSRFVIKIILGGEIWEGDAFQVSSFVPYDSIIFAGSEILSFEEV